MLDKFEIARSLQEIATLLRLKGESPFKARAYEQGALAIEGVTEDIATLVDERRLTDLAHVGTAIAGQVAELWHTGRSSMLDRLENEVPPGTVELSRVRGLTIARIRALHEALGVSSVEELRKACEAHRVRTVRGFGAKTEQRILDAISLHETRENRVLLLDALASAKRLVAYLSGNSAVQQVALAGEARRYHESVSELEIVIATREVSQVLAYVARFLGMTVFDPEERVGRLAGGLRVRCHVTSPEAFAWALVLYTGSPEHVAKLAEIAPKPLVNPETEARVYETAGLVYVPPELREDQGEIEAARERKSPFDLIQESALRGMVHCHTLYSDGKNSIEEMARAAESLGMQYITITDHSPSAFYANGVELDRLKRQWDEIAEVQERVTIQILRGTESDILADGALDYPDSVLESFDVIIASIHSRMKMDREQMTARLVHALTLPVFKIWGHALGRLVLRRPPIDCDVERILDAVSGSRTAIEINSDPYRLDLAPEWLRKAHERNIPFVISTDAHSTHGLGVLHFGVGMARRAGLTSNDVLNTLDSSEFRRRVRPV